MRTTVTAREGFAGAQLLLEALADAVLGGDDVAAFDSLFDALAGIYAAASESGREEIRQAVLSSRWAGAGLWGRGRQSFFNRFRDERQASDLKRALLLESMFNGGSDPRDTIAGVSDLVYWATASDLDAGPILREVANVSSSESMLGMESMQAFLARMARR